MHQKSPNIYKKARANAGLTQERAAEVLNLSVESIKSYETGVRVPPASTVAGMAEVYGSPGLRLEHARATDELGIIPEDARPRSLEQNVLRWPRLARTLHQVLPRLAEIAEDGRVDADEADDFQSIQAFLGGEMLASCLELKCCSGAKRERPEAATSKRSGSNGFATPKNHEFIIPQSRENASKIARKKAVNAP